VANADQADTDDDGVGDACPPGSDVDNADNADADMVGGCSTSGGASPLVLLLACLLLRRRRSVVTAANGR
jgi:hypothetical protein